MEETITVLGNAGENTSISRRLIIIALSAALICALGFIGWQSLKAYKVKIYNQGALEMQAAIGQNILNQLNNTGQLVVDTPNGQVILKQ